MRERGQSIYRGSGRGAARITETSAARMLGGGEAARRQDARCTASRCPAACISTPISGLLLHSPSLPLRFACPHSFLSWHPGRTSRWYTFCHPRAQCKEHERGRQSGAEPPCLPLCHRQTAVFSKRDEDRRSPSPSRTAPFLHSTRNPGNNMRTPRKFSPRRYDVSRFTILYTVMKIYTRICVNAICQPFVTL